MEQFAREFAAMSAGSFWFYMFILGVFVLGTFVNAFAQLRKSRVIRDAPTSKIRSAAQGHVELQGLTRQADEPITSPLSRKACAWWHYKLEEKQRDSDGDKIWVTLEKGESITPFALEDDTGRCLVEPIGAEVIHAEERCWHGRGRDDALRPERNVFWFRKFRFTERYLWYDQPLYALGEFRTEDADGGLEHRLGKADGEPFILSCKPQHVLAREYRRSAVRSYAWFVLLGALFAATLAARIGTGNGPRDVPAGWAVLERSPWPNQDKLHERYVQLTPTTVGPVRRLTFKIVNRRKRGDTGWDEGRYLYTYYDCARGIIAVESISEGPRAEYERQFLAGEARGGGVPFGNERDRTGPRVAGAPDLPTLACGPSATSLVATPAPPWPPAAPAPWSALRLGNSDGAEMQFYLQRSSSDVGQLRRLTFKKIAVGSSEGVDGTGWPTYHHYYDCAGGRVSAAVDDAVREIFERDVADPRRASRVGGWLTFDQTEPAAFGFRGDPEVVAIACKDAPGVTVR